MKENFSDFEITQLSLQRQELNLKIDHYLKEHLSENPKYKNTKRLNLFEFQGYSQNGEDGIIEEIFERIGVTNKFFVEIGAGFGLENNTTYLLLKDWQGLWVDANTQNTEFTRDKFSKLIRECKLKVRNATITAENIEIILSEEEMPQEIDLLSIDIDGNDYWVWKAINKYNPRVVVIEYNAFFKPPVKWVMKYNPHFNWDHNTMYFNSSLKSLEILGKEKGYHLVGCTFTGVNAFFVRQDLTKDSFFEPFTAENHFEPTRYHLTRKTGFQRWFGEFESI